MISHDRERTADIEDEFPVDVSETVSIDCEVTQAGWRPTWLRAMRRGGILLKADKSLRFVVTSCSVGEHYTLKWKVRNRGPEAERRDKNPQPDHRLEQAGSPHQALGLQGRARRRVLRRHGRGRRRSGPDRRAGQQHERQDGERLVGNRSSERDEAPPNLPGPRRTRRIRP